MLNKQQEQTLKYLLSMKKDLENKISVSKNNYSLENISENDFISYINYLEQCGLISIHWISPHHDNIIHTVNIKLLPDGINYFHNKKIKSKQNRRELIKTYIPIIISLIALLKSFQPEIISVMKLIMQLLKQ